MAISSVNTNPPASSPVNSPLSQISSGETRGERISTYA